MTAETKQAFLTKGLSLHRNAASVGRFLWHFLEMFIAMMIGMGVYHLLTGKALAAYPVVNYAGMELSMIPPMVALMWFQGHSWDCSRDMVVAMLVGPALFLTCAQLGLNNYIPGISRETLFGLSDATMYLGMLGAMLIHREMYTQPHAGHKHGVRREAAVERAGYGVKLQLPGRVLPEAAAATAAEVSQEQMIPITGMTCASCVRHVEQALGKVPGIESVKVNLATERAVVRGVINLEAIRDAVEEAGYGIGQAASQEAAAQDLTAFLGAGADVIVDSGDLRHVMHMYAQPGVPRQSGMREMPAPTLPFGPNLGFTQTFEEPGLYKLWVELEHRGQVINAPFTIEVK